MEPFTEHSLQSLIRSCQTDRELRDAIRKLKCELATRQAQRLYTRIEKAIAPLGTAERAAILAVYNNHRAPIEDPEVLQKLRDAKLAVLGGSLTMLGMRAAAVLKMRGTP